MHCVTVTKWRCSYYFINGNDLKIVISLKIVWILKINSKQEVHEAITMMQ